MDSGIDSTESSNGSISDTCINTDNIQPEETQNLFSTKPEEDTNQNVSENSFKTHNFTNNLKPKKWILPNLGDEIDNCEQSSVSDGKKNEPVPFPNHFSFSIDPLKWELSHSVLKEKENNLDGSLHNTKSVPIKSSKTEFSVPPGCYLNFNISKKDEQRLMFNASNLAFQNTIFPSVRDACKVPCSSQSYSGSLELIPYRNKDLKRKLKIARLVRQLSAKPKERKLRMAAMVNNFELVEEMLREGVNPKATDWKQRSALHIAASKGYTEIAKLLLQHGADPNQKDSLGNTALHLAACTYHIETVILLIKAGTDVKQVDNQGYSPLHLAQSRLTLLQQDPNPCSQSLRSQVVQIVEMMQEYLKSSGHKEEAEMLSAMTCNLSLSDDSSPVDSDIQQLLASLQELTLSKVKKD